jgi:hypothetical protein
MGHERCIRPDHEAWRRLLERWNDDERAFSATVESPCNQLVARAATDDDLELVAAVHSHWGRATFVYALPGVGETPAERRGTRAWALVDHFEDEDYAFVKADGLEGVARMLERLEPLAEDVAVRSEVATEEP